MSSPTVARNSGSSSGSSWVLTTKSQRASLEAPSSQNEEPEACREAKKYHKFWTADHSSNIRLKNGKEFHLIPAKQLSIVISTPRRKGKIPASSLYLEIIRKPSFSNTQQVKKGKVILRKTKSKIISKENPSINQRIDKIIDNQQTEKYFTTAVQEECFVFCFPKEKEKIRNFDDLDLFFEYCLEIQKKKDDLLPKIFDYFIAWHKKHAAKDLSFFATLYQFSESEKKRLPENLLLQDINYSTTLTCLLMKRYLEFISTAKETFIENLSSWQSVILWSCYEACHTTIDTTIEIKGRLTDDVDNFFIITLGILYKENEVFFNTKTTKEIPAKEIHAVVQQSLGSRLLEKFMQAHWEEFVESVFLNNELTLDDKKAVFPRILIGSTVATKISIAHRIFHYILKNYLDNYDAKLMAALKCLIELESSRHILAEEKSPSSTISFHLLFLWYGADPTSLFDLIATEEGRFLGQQLFSIKQVNKLLPKPIDEFCNHYFSQGKEMLVNTFLFFLKQEIHDQATLGDMFRSDVWVSRALLKKFFKEFQSDYLNEISTLFKSSITSYFPTTVSGYDSIYPFQEGSPSNEQQNYAVIMGNFLQFFLKSLLKKTIPPAAGEVLKSMAEIFYNDSHIQALVESNSSEYGTKDMKSILKSEVLKQVGGFLFLRIICPNLTRVFPIEMLKENEKLCKLVNFIAGVVQNLSNNTQNQIPKLWGSGLNPDVYFQHFANYLGACIGWEESHIIPSATFGSTPLSRKPSSESEPALQRLRREPEVRKFLSSQRLKSNSLES